MHKCFVKIANVFRQKSTNPPTEVEYLNGVSEVDMRHGGAYLDNVGERESNEREVGEANSEKANTQTAGVKDKQRPNNISSDKHKECRDKCSDNIDKTINATTSTSTSIITNAAKPQRVDGIVNSVLNERIAARNKRGNEVVKQKENKTKYFLRSATSPSLGKVEHDVGMMSSTDMSDVVYRCSYQGGGAGENRNSARSSTRSSGIFRLFLGSSKKKKNEKGKDKEKEKEKEKKKECGNEKEKEKAKKKGKEKVAPLAAMEPQQLGFDEDEEKAFTKVNKSSNIAPKALKEMRTDAGVDKKKNTSNDIKAELLHSTNDKSARRKIATHINTTTCGKDIDDSDTHRYSAKGDVDVTSEAAVDIKCMPHHAKTKSIEAHDERSYISEYKSFVEDERPNLIGSPFPETEAFNFEKALNRKTSERHSSPLVDIQNKCGVDVKAQLSSSHANLNDYILGHTNGLTPKTPEEIEYEKNIAAESADIMTPLPQNLTFHSARLSLSTGRTLASDIADMIRNLDANTLRINNMTVEEKMELMKRFEQPQQQQQHEKQLQTSQIHHPHYQNHHASNTNQHSPLRRASSARNVNPMRLAMENRIAMQATALTSTTASVSAAQQLQGVGGGGADESTCDSDGENVEVVLRRKFVDYPGGEKVTVSTCLYERRQPKCPKLKLLVQSQNNENREEGSAERSLMDVKFPTVLPPNPQLKALLVFHKSDNICEVVTEACHRQQLDVTVARTKEGALETLSSTSEEFYHLIIIDARSTKHLDAEYIARSIRHTKGHHFTTIIAVVKKSFFEKDDVLIALLDAGVNRCVPETTNLSMCSIELKQILHSIVRPHNVMSTQQALYTALHRLKEVILITDNHLRIQYANRAAERLLNMRLDEIISKPLTDIFITDVSSFMMQSRKNKEFDEILTVRRKGQEDVSMHIRVIQVACIGRTPTHFVFNLDVPGSHGDFVATLPQAREAPRGSQHSIRRGSVDVRSVASDGLRRTSLAKLTSLPLEAPITKENCSPDEARLIDKVMEFLKREGLYSPQMKEIRTDDPIATDLIGALLTGPSLYSSRRSSNDSIIRVTGRQSTSMPAKMKATPHIMELLEESLSWEFDIFKLEEITEKRPLLYLGMEMFRRFNVFATLNIDENVCKSWLAVIEANYHANNSYHNSTHAADVMQATGCFLTQLAAKDMGMDHTDEAIALIAAAAHDIDHPGRSSAFLCNSRNALALLYNDLCVLESHHASITFRLTLSDDKINIFKNLDTESYKSVRSVVIDMILATEMTRHFEHLAKFVSIFGSDEEPKDIVQSEEESSILIRRMMIKVADVSNPSRQPSYCVEWARRIAEEYFTQTDEEKAKALPIVMPMFDRNTCSIPKSQIGFIEYIIQDMMHAWDSFIDMPQLVTYMQINYSQWKKFEEQGVHTLADVKSKQHSLSVKKSAK
ncbi:high affinity cAMP-specific and IBMX-insensitive 3',5'-cyclic phosphodiesterase 8 isoform X2 [Anastrepha ludens]|uniref:high affinity cAMP-specific and IBMX-insensitive 3',5'-cyclic phosphodiesterase 8 isoform X2 n=1 Tax=Anastrepha ludens TaxID=28586 RepID=UPI0023AFB621|nr:high affinity cAMP-specific and IBMX-insensitive 3',5'-cyclic phosphodiesterase 8 isoform X2 [Anastrepha ludens]